MDLNSVNLSEYYERYRSFRVSENFDVKLADYGWRERPDRIGATWLAYDLMLDEFEIGLANSVNMLVEYAARLRTWGRVLSDCDDNVTMALTFEFTESLALAALGAPYSLKMRFIYAATHLCHQANRTKLGDQWTDNLVDDRDINKKSLILVGSKWDSYQEFFDLLEKLYSTEHEERTSFFRVGATHRSPNRQISGHTAFVRRRRSKSLQDLPSNSPYSAVYEYGQTPPFDVQILSTEIAGQGEIAYEVYRNFKKLVLEQLNAILEAQNRRY